MKQTIPAVIAIALGVSALAACTPRPAAREASAPAAAPVARTAPVAEARPAPTPLPASVPREALTDSVITAKIKAGILSDPGMTGTDVSVNTDRGVVHLAGTIKSQEQAAIASAHASRQDGVLRVDNELSVNPQ